MIKSMTGYGKAECLLPDKKITIEIRTLNSKQLDVNMRIPAQYKEKELEMRQQIAARLERGKVECSLFFELSDNVLTGTINEAAVKLYYEQLYRISGELGLEASQDLLATVMRLPDTIQSEKPDLEENEWESVKKCVEEALGQVIEFREREGSCLEEDLKLRVSSISEKLLGIEKYEPERISRIKDRISGNLGEIASPGALDENRFEQEMIYYIEKLDISEEKVRLKNHCDYFLETVGREKSEGKKLGFISQEMGREINTLGSKANHSDIQRLVVEMKDELEKIKEQILNIL